jgi:hypothetical protein
LGGAGIISAAFIFAETLDLVSSGLKSYFSSISNLLDLYSYIVPVLHLTNLIFNLVDIPDIYMSVFMAITTIILFFEALTLMVAAGEIGKFIRMFFEVIKATRFFLLTLLIFLGAFLLAFAAIASYSPSSSAFLNLYLVLVNQNNLDMLKNAGAGTALSNSGTTTLFVIFSFFVMIIMFNLLIALINDIYSDITKDIDAVVVRSKMNMLKKIEKFFFPFSSWYSKKQRETEQKESSNFPDWMVYIVSKEVYVESRK